MKKNLLFALSLLMVASMVLTACGAAPATQAPATEEAAQFTCALITPNPLGDPYPVKTSSKMDDSRKPAHPSCLQ